MPGGAAQVEISAGCWRWPSPRLRPAPEYRVAPPGGLALSSVTSCNLQPANPYQDCGRILSSDPDLCLPLRCVLLGWAGENNAGQESISPRLLPPCVHGEPRGEPGELQQPDGCQGQCSANGEGLQSGHLLAKNIVSLSDCRKCTLATFRASRP